MIDYKCNICEKRCGRQPVLKCVNCSEYQHVYCTKLTKTQSSLHLISNDSYFCMICIKKIFPLQKLCNTEFNAIFQHQYKSGVRREITNTLNSEIDLEGLIRADCKYLSVEWYKTSTLDSKKQQFFFRNAF